MSDDPTEGGRTWARWAPLVAGLLLASPALAFRYPPSTDLAMHESLVSILRHFGDASRFPPGLYQLNLGHPNQLFHLLAYALSFVVSTPVAVRIVLAGAMVGVPVGAERFARYIGASPWAAVPFATIASGWFLFIGLVANTLGLGLLLALTPTLDRYVKRPSASGAAKVIGAVVLLYLAHESAMVLYALLGAICALGEPLRLRSFAARMVPSAVAFFMTIGQLYVQRVPAAIALATLPTAPISMPLPLKLSAIPSVLLGGYDRPLSRVITFVIFGVMALLVAQRWRDHRASGTPVPRAFTPFVSAYRFEIFGAMCFGAYLVAPTHVNGATYVYHRFLAPTVGFALVTASPRRTDGLLPKLFRATPLLSAFVPIAMLLVVLPAYAESSRNYDAMNRILAHVAPGSAMAAIHDVGPSWTTAMSSRAVAERGGRMLFSFTESPIAPVKTRDAVAWREPISRVVPRSNGWCPAFDFTRFRYLFFSTPNPGRGFLMARALAPEARPIATAGDWVLFESTLPVVSPTSPPVPMPAICLTDDLGARMVKLAIADGVAPPPSVHR